MEAAAAAAGAASGNADVACAQCGAPAKYTCPGCARRTCSLGCVRAHKAVHGCTGKRDRTAFVPLAEFTDAHLASDYTLLEEAAREGDAAKRARPRSAFAGGGRGGRGGRGGGRGRGRSGRGGRGSAADADDAEDADELRPPQERPDAALPRALHVLRAAARERGVSLRFMPPGMGRREANTTRLGGKGGGKGAKGSRTLHWRVELRFARTNGATGSEAAGCRQGTSAGETVVLESVDERAAVGAALGAALGGCGAAVRHRLREYVEAHEARAGETAGENAGGAAAEGHGGDGARAGGGDGCVHEHDTPLRLLLRKELCRADRQVYYALDPRAPLREALVGRTLVEFPTLAVALPEEVKAGDYLVVGENATEEGELVGVEGSDSDSDSDSDSSEEADDMFNAGCAAAIAVATGVCDGGDGGGRGNCGVCSGGNSCHASGGNSDALEEGEVVQARGVSRGAE